MLELPYSVKVLQQQPTDSKVGPFFTVAQALLENVPGIRVQGLLTVVITAGKPSLYWFENGIADSDFVPYVIDAGYSSALQFESSRSISGSLFYNTIQAIGYLPGNIAYQNIVGGDDRTAVVGNLLRPFKTIGAAISALGYLTNALLSCAAGVNNIYDADCPQGIKPQGSTFDIYLETGCTINYYGTYGVFISDIYTGGSIFGNGIIVNYSATATGSVDGISGYTVNIAGANSPYNNKKLQFERLLNYSQINFIRIGDCVTYNSGVTFISNGFGLIQNANAAAYNCITLDTNSKTSLLGFKNGGYIGNVLAGSGLVLKINNAANVTVDECTFYSHGNQFGATMPVALEIKAESSIDIKFINSEIRFAGSATGYSVVNFKNINLDYSTVLFDRCKLRSRASNMYPANGYVISCDNDISLKLMDTYGHQDINPAKSVINVISTVSGYSKEPYL